MRAILAGLILAGFSTLSLGCEPDQMGGTPAPPDDPLAERADALMPDGQAPAEEAPPVETDQPEDGPGVEGQPIDPEIAQVVCGNGRLDPGESCDDSNALDGDGCDSNCQPTCPDSPPSTDICSNNAAIRDPARAACRAHFSCWYETRRVVAVRARDRCRVSPPGPNWNCDEGYTFDLAAAQRQRDAALTGICVCQ